MMRMMMMMMMMMLMMLMMMMMMIQPSFFDRRHGTHSNDHGFRDDGFQHYDGITSGRLWKFG
jgi:hypothetical protein